MECLRHFDGIVPSVESILTKEHSIHGGKCLSKTPGNAISETLNFKMSLDASALQNWCLWCEFQSHLLFIISLLLENFFDSPASLALFTFLLCVYVCLLKMWAFILIWVFAFFCFAVIFKHSCGLCSFQLCLK